MSHVEEFESATALADETSRITIDPLQPGRVRRVIGPGDQLRIERFLFYRELGLFVS